MPNMTVRNIDPKIYERLKDRARTNHRSLEAETRDILAAAVKPTAEEFVAWCREFRAKQKVPKDWDSTALIRADRDSDYKASRE